MNTSKFLILILLWVGLANAFANATATTKAMNQSQSPSINNPPEYLTLLKHYAHENSLNLNPGFIDQAGIKRDQSLQACLNSELAKAQTPQKFPHKFGIALVDLTGERLQQPSYADFDAQITMYGASQSKAAALLGAHQLLYDLRQASQELAAQGKKSLQDLMAKVSQMQQTTIEPQALTDKFDLKETAAGVDVSFAKTFEDELLQMIKFSNNDSASRVIKSVGFNFIHSVLWQEGFYDRAYGGGLWVGRTYKGGQLWHRDPVANQSHAINAISMAKFMTLIAQRRLVSPEMSEKIQGFMANTIYPIKFVEGFRSMGLKVNEDAPHIKEPTKRVTLYRKSGSMNGDIHNVSHDAAIIERTVCANKDCSQTKELRYVATAASKDSATSQVPRFIQLMDLCILKNNGLAQ